MQRRRAVGAIAVAVAFGSTIVTSGVTANAQSDEDRPGALDASREQADTVVLPTGDRVWELPDGTFGLEPGEGRDDVGFLTVPAANGGDTLILPRDRVDELRSGAEDARRYNVSRLIADDHAHAADLSASELERYAGLPPTSGHTDAAAPTLSVTIRDRSGAVPEGNWVNWYDADDHGNRGTMEFGADGSATVALEPGEYTLTHVVWNDPTATDRGETAYGLSHVVIEDENVDLLLDSGQARPISVEVERSDAELVSYGAAVMASAPDGSGIGAGDFNGPGIDLFLMPEPDMPGYDFGFQYQPTLAGPEGSAEPYQYNLAFAQTGGYPDDTAFRVTDDELAAVTTRYTGFGAAVDGYTCDNGDLAAERIGMGLCQMIATPFPSERLNLYTADPEISWYSLIEGGRYDPEGRRLLDGFHEFDEHFFEPGASERTFPHGPVTAGPTEAVLSNTDGFARFDTFVSLGTGANDERVDLIGYTGDAVLVLDDEKVGRFDDFDPYGGFGFELAEPAAGRYTLAVEGTREPTTGPFATESAIEWAFDLDPASLEPGQYRSLSLPAVRLTADGVDGGWAEDCEQEVRLTLVDHAGEAVRAQAITFEVSYDDGRSWSSVDIERDGSGATAVLEHPEAAEYVSTRMTATDDAGTEVVHTTIRSYGLR
ncbi:hypothetical protein [Glycomyces tarimensis]